MRGWRGRRGLLLLCSGACLVLLLLLQFQLHLPGLQPPPAETLLRDGDWECRTALDALIPSGEQFFRVATARVLVADYALLRRDFPHLRNLPDAAAIDAWLVEEVAFLSSNHFAHEYRDPPKPGEPVPPTRLGEYTPFKRKVHTPVKRALDQDGKPIVRRLPVVRPPSYKRAAVFTLSGSGTTTMMLDVKGIGLVPPSPPISHGSMTGLLVVYEALAEFAWAQVARRILNRGGESEVSVLPHYAVIDLGFDFIVYPDSHWLSPATNGTVGAALLVRAAHCRDGMRMAINESLRLEQIFRRYGLSTCTRNSLPETCLLNYQGSKDKQLVDLVAIKTLQPHQWSWPVVFGVAGGEEMNRSQASMMPIDQQKPDPELMVHVDDPYWGLSEGGSTRGHRRIYQHTLDLHERWRRGELRTGAELQAELRKLVQRLPFMRDE